MTTEPTPTDTPSTNITEQPAPAPPPAPNTAITETPASPVAPSPSSAGGAENAAPSPSLATGPSTWPFRTDVILLVMLLVLTFFLGSFTATNSDLWLNLAIGKRYSEGKFAFGVDPYSWATEAHGDKPAVYWVNHSWLYCWILYLLHGVAGGAGLVIAKALVFTAAIGILVSIGWKEASRWFTLLCLVMAAMVVSHRVLVQPMVVSMLFMAITLWVLHYVGIFAARREETPDRTRWLWALPPLFALWANLDAWFILGPMLVGLCWAGTGLTKWYPNGNPVPGKTLGLVFGAGVLACLVNPHFVRVFQLPPELGYMLLALADPFGVPLPDALVAAGRTHKGLAAIDPNTPVTASALSAVYWKNPSTGLNAAGMAFYPLIVLGLAAFTLVALVRQPAEVPGGARGAIGPPRFQVNRFLPWLAFAVMALTLWRMIPFFALVAAPLTALTLGEFLQWQQANNATSSGRGERGLNLARLVSIPFLLLLLYLAWPGWLHGVATSELFSARRRVAWEVRPDPWQKRAAESLQELQQKGECHNVFNIAPDFGNYLPWFAPEVKYFMDSRVALYAGQVGTFDKVRKALNDPDIKADAWQKLFAEHDIRQAVTGNNTNYLKWWSEGDQWRQRYSHLRATVFSWAGPGKTWPSNTAEADWNRQAFGASVRKPPAAGIEPLSMPSVWSLYLDGVGPLPVEVGEFSVEHGNLLYELQRGWRPTVYAPSMIWHCAALANLQSIPFVAVLGNQLAPRDLWPPALPVVMVRTARIAVAENPIDPDTHVVLQKANDALRFQEDNWIGYRADPRRRHPSMLRDMIRETQTVATALHLTQLQPDNFKWQNEMADVYRKQKLYDLELEHRQLAAKALPAFLDSVKDAPKNPKDREAILKNYQETMVAPLEKSVRVRLKYLKENFEKAPPLVKVEQAFGGDFREVSEHGIVNTPLGLAKKALELILAIDPNTLKNDEQQKYELIRLTLFLKMGDVDTVATYLKKEPVRKSLPPILYAQHQLATSAVLGDYDSMNEALTEMESGIRAGIRANREVLNARRGIAAIPMVLAAAQPHSPTGIYAGFAQTQRWQLQVFQSEYQLAQLNYELFNAMTLRGIAALEAGDTKHARNIFQQILTEAGTEHVFSDRPIAQHYRDLLTQQLGK